MDYKSHIIFVYSHAKGVCCAYYRDIAFYEIFLNILLFRWNQTSMKCPGNITFCLQEFGKIFRVFAFGTVNYNTAGIVISYAEQLQNSFIFLINTCGINFIDQV